MFSYKKVAGTVLIFTLILTTILILIAYRQPDSNKKEYMLKEYNGNVALYYGDEVLSVYDGVVLSTFPGKDRQKFSDGIIVNSPDDAEMMIEDYDG